MKSFKKVFAATLAVSMLGTVGVTVPASAEDTSENENAEVRKVIFSEDFEGYDVGTARPATVGGAEQNWGSIFANNENQYVAEIVQAENIGSKALHIGSNGWNVNQKMTEFISFGQTLSEGKYEFSYDVYAQRPGAYSEYFMSLADADGKRATWEGLGVGCFWLCHNTISPGAPAIGAIGNGFSAYGMDKDYVTVKTIVDLDAGTYQTYVGTSGGQTIPLNTDSISGMKSTFINDGRYNSNGDSYGAYYIDNVKVTKLYQLIHDLPIEDGAAFEKEYTLPEFTPAEEGVTYELSYTMNGEAVTLKAGDVLGVGRYTVTIHAADSENNTASKTISFTVGPKITYTDEKEVIFLEDFEGYDVGTKRPATVGGAEQDWGYIVANNEKQYVSEIVQAENIGSKALHIGSNGWNVNQKMTEFISFGQTFSKGKYEFSYDVYAQRPGAYSEYFMSLADADGKRATWEGLGAGCFWICHNSISPGAPAIGAIGNGFSAYGMTKGYVTVRTIVDLDAGTYQTYVGTSGGQKFDLNTDSISGMKSTFINDGAYNSNGDSYGAYYIDNIKIEKYYGLAVDLPFHTGNTYKEGYRVPEVKPAEGVSYTSVTYTKDGEPIVLNTGDSLEIGKYTMTVTATDGYNTETRTAEFEIVPAVTYNGEYEVILSEDFDDKTEGEQPAEIGGVAQELAMSTVVSDDGNKVLSIKGNDGQEYISFGKSLREGKHDISYRFKVVKHATGVSEFMRLASSEKKFASYELFTNGYFWFGRSDAGYPLAGFYSMVESGLPRDAYASYQYSVVDGMFTPLYNNSITPGQLGGAGVKSYDGLLTTLNSNAQDGFKGTEDGENEIYIDDIKVIEYYGLAVNLPFETGKTYPVGTVVPEVTPSVDRATFESVTYTKDGEAFTPEVGDQLAAGEYTMTVVATDGYNKETRTVKFNVESTFCVTNAATLQNGNTVTAKVALSIPDDYTEDFDVIVVMKPADKNTISSVQHIGREALEDGVATFRFDVPEEGSYEFEYYVWNMKTMQPLTEKGSFTQGDTSL